MIIGIDVSRMENTAKTGTENYTGEIVKRLIDSDRENKYILYSRFPLGLSLPRNFHNKVLRSRVFWTHWRLSLEMLVNPPHALFVPAHTVPIIHPRNTAVIIHGLEYEYFPQAYPFKKKLVNKIGTYFSARWAKVIITPSTSTKDDLVKLYKINSEKIKVIYPGVNKDEYGEGNRESKFQGQFSNVPYIFFLGRIELRKNLLRMIKAFERIKKEKKMPHKLVLAGKSDYGSEIIQKAAEESSCREDIILAGYVGEDDKKWLLRHAALFLFPTLREGFGFPVLEAMAGGVPVITSKVGGSREAAGEAALLVDPKSVDEIADSIYKLISNNSLSRQLIEKGYQNIERFDWDKCVKEIQKVLAFE